MLKVHAESSRGGGIKKEMIKSSLFLRAEDGAQTRDPQLGRLMLYRLSYFRIFCGRRWIRTTEVERQLSYSQSHLATLVFALLLLRTSQLSC